MQTNSFRTLQDLIAASTTMDAKMTAQQMGQLPEGLTFRSFSQDDLAVILYHANGHIVVTLEPTDTYRVSIVKFEPLSGFFNWFVKNTTGGVYAEDLCAVVRQTCAMLTV
jgi:hypothetical protein